MDDETALRAVSGFVLAVVVAKTAAALLGGGSVQPMETVVAGVAVLGLLAAVIPGLRENSVAVGVVLVALLLYAADTAVGATGPVDLLFAGVAALLGILGLVRLVERDVAASSTG